MLNKSSILTAPLLPWLHEMKTHFYNYLSQERFSLLL